MSLTYEEARPLIKDGDVISVRETHGFLAPFTRFFTRSPHTHSGIAVWIDQGLWMAELNGGKNHLIPMSQLAETDFDVSDCPVPNRFAVRDAIFNSLRVKIPYSLVALVAIGLLSFFGIKKFVHWREMLVCSGDIVAILEAAGWPEHTRILSPGDLYGLLEPKLSVRN